MTLLFKELDKYFNIIIADSNPFVLNTSEIFKKNSKIEYISNQKTYNLYKYQLNITDISSIKSIIFNECDTEDLNMSKNIFKRLFRTNISSKIKLQSKNFIITSQEISDRYLKDFKCEIFLEDIDSIIIGEKTNLIIRFISDNEIELFFDKEKFKNYIIS